MASDLNLLIAIDFKDFISEATIIYPLLPVEKAISANPYIYY